MRDSTLPPEVIRFIHDCIDRLETLDVLVLLHGDPSKPWTKEELRAHMRSSVLATETALERLVATGLVGQQGDAFAFRARSSDLNAQARRLLDCYREKRTAVISAIFSRPSHAVQSFADAFRIKKGD